MTDDRSAAARAGIRRLSGLTDAQLNITIAGDAAAADSYSVHSSDGVLHLTATSPAVALAGYAQFARRTASLARQVRGRDEHGRDPVGVVLAGVPQPLHQGADLRDPRRHGRTRASAGTSA